MLNGERYVGVESSQDGRSRVDSILDNRTGDNYATIIVLFNE
jgi:hypothetical protein